MVSNNYIAAFLIVDDIIGLLGNLLVILTIFFVLRNKVLAFSQVIAAFLIVVDAIGLPGNLLVIVTVFWETRFHVFRYILLASLAASDVMFLILVNSFRIAGIVRQRWLYGETMCRLNPLFSRFFYINTVAHLIAVSYDRYRAIVKSPLTYHGAMTKSKVISVLLIWIIPIPFTIAPYLVYGNQYVYNPELCYCEEDLENRDVHSSAKLIFFMLVGFIVPFVVIIFLNCSVYKRAKRQANAIRSISSQIGHRGNSAESQLQPPRQRIEMKAAVDVSIIIAAFLLCYLPGWIMSICRQFVSSVKFHPRLFWSRLVFSLPTHCVIQLSIPSVKDTSEPG